MKKALILSLLLLSANTYSYNIQKDLPVNYDLVTAGSKPVALLGNQVNVGDIAPNFKVVDGKFRQKTLNDFKGKPILISSVPSLDTGVCSLQTKRLNEEVANLPQDAVILTISADLPFAQKRFCQQENIEKLETLSDSVWRDFAMNYGLLIKDMGLIARAMIVISPDGTVTYKEIVQKLSNQPNFDAALQALIKVSEQSQTPAETQQTTQSVSTN